MTHEDFIIDLQMPLVEFEQRTLGVFRAIELSHMLPDAETDMVKIADQIECMAGALGFFTGDNLAAFLLEVEPSPFYEEHA